MDIGEFSMWLVHNPRTLLVAWIQQLSESVSPNLQGLLGRQVEGYRTLLAAMSGWFIGFPLGFPAISNQMKLVG